MKKLLFGFLLGLVVGIGGYWYIETTQHKDPLRYAGEQVVSGADKAKKTIQDKVSEISADQIKEELARTRMVVREKARVVGQAISDVTANARITAAIKAKLITEPGVPGLNINVDTTDGLVTLSGTVSSHEEVAKA